MIYTQSRKRTSILMQQGGGTPAQDFNWLVKYQPLKIEAHNAEQIDAAKNRAPYFIAGTLTPDAETGKLKRNDGALVARSILVLDFDHCDVKKLLAALNSKLAGIEWLAYPTISNGYKEAAQGDRYRVAVKLDRPYKQPEHAGLLDRVSALLGFEMDKDARQWSQVMGLPVITPKNPATAIVHNAGKALAVDQYTVASRDAIAKGVHKTDTPSPHHTVTIPDKEARTILTDWAERHKDELEGDDAEAFSASVIMFLACSERAGEISADFLTEAMDTIALGSNDWAQGNAVKLADQQKRNLTPNELSFRERFTGIPDAADDFDDWKTDEEGVKGPKPFDVREYPGPRKEVLCDPRLLTAFNEQLAARLPKWLNVWFTITGTKDTPTAKRNIQLDEVAYGDELLKARPLISMSALPEGAQYLPDSGTWEMFKRGGANAVIEATATTELKAWGAYSDNNVQKIRKYVRRASHDPNAGGSTPFSRAKPELVAFKNGTYNILTGEIREHRASDYLRSRHDYVIDPDQHEAPETVKLLTAMLGDAAPFLIEYIGYMFYHSYAPFQMLVFMHGEGGEGKTTLLNHIKNNILGEENVAAVPPKALAGDRAHFDIMLLRDKEANMVPDVSDGHLANTGMLKALTGNDMTKGENKGIDGVNFTNYAKLLFAANSMPTFSDNSAGFADRVKIMKLINKDTRKQPGWWDQFNAHKIEAEAPAFAMKCIQAFKLALDRGSFTKSEALENSTMDWLKENDYFGQFMNERCHYIPGNTDMKTNAADLVTNCREWYQEQGFTPISARKITDRLKKLGYPKKKARIHGGKPDWAYIGIILNRDAGAVFDEADKKTPGG